MKRKRTFKLFRKLENLGNFFSAVFAISLVIWACVMFNIKLVHQASTIKVNLYNGGRNPLIIGISSSKTKKGIKEKERTGNLTNKDAIQYKLTRYRSKLPKNVTYNRKMKAKRYENVGSESVDTDKKYLKSSPDSFVDVAFEPLLEAFKKYHPKKFTPPFRSARTPRFLLVANRKLQSPFWTQQTKHIYLNECPLPCWVTEDVTDTRVNAVVFFLRGLHGKNHMYQKIPHRDFSKPWVMLNFEAHRAPSGMHQRSLNIYNGVFNRTMSFRKDADVIFNHGFIVAKSDAKHLPPSWVVPSPTYTRSTFNKSLAVGFITNCRDLSGRMDYIRELQKYAPIDIYGKCGELSCGFRKYADTNYNVITDRCYKMAAYNYLFYLSFENSLCRDYVTEKLYNILYYNVVPIVFGGADYTKLLPPNSYINALDYTPKKLAEYLLYLQKNIHLYEEYLKWRDLYQVSTISGVRPLCHLCVKLYDPKFYRKSIVRNFGSWYSAESMCKPRWKHEL